VLASIVGLWRGPVLCAFTLCGPNFVQTVAPFWGPSCFGYRKKHNHQQRNHHHCHLHLRTRGTSRKNQCGCVSADVQINANCPNPSSDQCPDQFTDAQISADAQINVCAGVSLCVGVSVCVCCVCCGCGCVCCWCEAWGPHLLVRLPASNLDPVVIFFGCPTRLTQND
jgi:hypothetical protein